MEESRFRVTCAYGHLVGLAARDYDALQDARRRAACIDAGKDPKLARWALDQLRGRYAAYAAAVRLVSDASGIRMADVKRDIEAAAMRRGAGE